MELLIAIASAVLVWGSAFALLLMPKPGPPKIARGPDPRRNFSVCPACGNPEVHGHRYDGCVTVGCQENHT